MSSKIANESIHFRLTHYGELYETAPKATTSQPTRTMRLRNHQEDESMLNVRGVRISTRRTGDVALFAPSPFKPRQGCLSVCSISRAQGGIEAKRNGLAPDNSGVSPLQQIYCESFDTLGKRLRRPASAALGLCPAFREGKDTKHLPLRARKATVAQTSCFASRTFLCRCRPCSQ